MKKLHSLALCALVTPALTLSAGSVLAQQSTDTKMDRTSSSMQSDEDARTSGAVSTQDARGKQSYEKSASKKHHKGFMDAAPAKGMHATNLMDATVKTTDGEDVGSVSDLVVDEDGQIVAIVVGVGGILGMGEKAVAIGWDDVTRSSASKKSGKSSQSADSDDLALQINKSRDDLRSAPEFKTRE